MADFVLTPWESRGRIDYGHLMERFGLRPLDDRTFVGRLSAGRRRGALSW